MRVCIVQTVLPLYSISFFNRIVELYPEIDLVVLADIESPQPLNQYRSEICAFQVKQLDSSNYKGVEWRPGIVRVIRSQGPDRVVFSGYVRDLGQLWAMIFFKITGSSFGVWGMFHRIGGPRCVTNLYFYLVGMLASRCLTYTRVGASQLINQGIPKNRIDVIGTAIDEKIPMAQVRNKSAADLLAFRDANGINDRKVILQVVRLSRIKRPELLVEAARELVREHNDVLFVLIGDGEMRSELEKKIEVLGLQSNFRLLGSIYDESLISYWFLSAKALVVPTFIGLSAHHAMSYGVPVVTDDSLDCQGSEYEILAEGLNSLVYKEGDPKDLARVLGRILNDQFLQQSLSTNALLTIKRTHNLDAKTHRFIRSVRALGGFR